ncbi:hypothetical protein O181_076311 [Austropuccinia psidii MF-1]|uniref:Reverse transcriptase Ty1/copia-type domain-containing protein n=1 Tax=Austropuccinia psidii MF-1 TaxID=1389203 RepID=A0A9Q3FA55_9BASI|nr:hypothetical protein [Austropuccinia psidii MF-1]
MENIAILRKRIDDFKKEIASEFEIKDIGPADLILGIKVNQTKDGICLYQKHFSKSLDSLYSMGECWSVSTSLVPHSHLSPETEDEVTEFSYQSALSSINYLSSIMKPDLSFVVSSLSQYLERPWI